MNPTNSCRDTLIDSLFSDETALFRTPAEPEIGDAVSVRLRVRRGAEIEAALLVGMPVRTIPMALAGCDDLFDWYEAPLGIAGEEPLFYTFLLRCADGFIHLLKTGPETVEDVPSLDPARAFRAIPGFHVPEWARGALQYQIFTDRFRNGCEDSDVREREYFYAGDYVHTARWDDLPEMGDFRCLYGGDLPGVMEKLDYLQSLGVEVIYFNPLFISPSSHKYDTQDYRHIDPHFTDVVCDGAVLPKGERDNARAERYIRATTDSACLRASDAFFARFCDAVHRRGMRIILDGVFNHCGSFNAWMDREGIYPRIGAYDDPKSPWRDYFRFDEDGQYEAWWNVDTLPKLNYEDSRALCEEIFGVAQKWLAPPYRVDGWRLDVAADLGHSRQFNHLFWQEFRRRVKAVNPEAIIIAEHYGDPSEWLNGREWDTVMNYDAFMEPVTWFLTGMEKHSDQYRGDLHQNGPAFFEAMGEAMARLPRPALECAMNELSNHDHSRFMTRTNSRSGRLDTAGSAAASEGIRPDVFREAVVIQMTWPGAPTTYYGDEAGLAGWTDPDNRRTYPWGHEDQSLIGLHRALAKLRRALPVLKRGSVKPIHAAEGVIAYARFDASDRAAVVCNNNDEPLAVTLPLAGAGAPDGARAIRRFLTGCGGHDDRPAELGIVADGCLDVTLPPRSAMILTF